MERAMHRMEQMVGDGMGITEGSGNRGERAPMDHIALLREMAKEAKVALEILPGMSFLDIMYTRLCMDPVEGLAIVDASDLDRLIHCQDFPLLVTQVYSQRIASDAKILLLELLPDEYEIIYAHNLALPDESIRRIPLFELDRQPDLDHLTSLFIPRYIESA